MTEEKILQPTENEQETLLNSAAHSLADVQESSRKAQELKDQLSANRNAVASLISSLFAAAPAAEAAFDAAVEEAAEQQERVEEQLESLENRLDTVFEALEDITGPAEVPPCPVPVSAETPTVEIETVEVAAIADEPAEEAAPALPEWFSLPAGFASLADLAADVDAKLQTLTDKLEDKAEAAAEKLEAAEAKAETTLAASLQQTLQQVSAGLAALGMLMPEAEEAEAETMEAAFEAAVEAEIEAEPEAEPEAEAETEIIAEEAPVSPAPAFMEDTVSIPLQEIAAAFPGYNPTWMALAHQETVAEPMEAPTTPLNEAATGGSSIFAPAWFKATEEKEMAAVKSAPAAEAAPVFAPPVIDEDDPVEIAARAMEAQRLREETEKMAAQLAEAERIRLKAEEELRRILQELEGEKQNAADDDIAAILRGFKH